MAPECQQCTVQNFWVCFEEHCSPTKHHIFLPVIEHFDVNHTIVVIFGTTSIILGIIGFYVILTQSKSLGNFKYYLINQTIWAQLFELAVLLLYPAALAPFPAYYMKGLLRNYLSYKSTVVFYVIWCGMYVNVQLGTVLSLMNRYISVFIPTYRKFTESKYAIIFIALIHIFFYVMLALAYGKTAENELIIREKAHNKSYGILDPYFIEPSFVYVEVNRKANTVIFYSNVTITLALILSIVFFIVSVIFHRKKAHILTKTATSLVVLSLAQAVIAVIFLLVPATFLIIAHLFSIPNTGYTISVLQSFYNFHSTADIICMLYCIVPYRRIRGSVATESKLALSYHTISFVQVTEEIKNSREKAKNNEDQNSVEKPTRSKNLQQSLPLGVYDGNTVVREIVILYC
uniref:Serpentine Receptor, class T n=1 Tax=Panagrellus redivivus TaxID=6233 RepID=A0A7E4VGW1_PANRE